VVRRRRRTSRRASRRPAPRKAGLVPPAVEERALPIVRELARVARGPERPARKLEGALEILFGAYAEGDPHFSDALVGGWARAREDKQFRLTMAWLREQSRLSLEEILEEGVKSGDFRSGLDAGAVATALLGAAEGCLLQSGSAGGTVPPARLLRALLALVEG